MDRLSVKIFRMQKAFIDAVSALIGTASASGTGEQEWNSLAVCIVRISECIADLKHFDPCADSGIRIDALFMVLWDYIVSLGNMLGEEPLSNADQVWVSHCMNRFADEARSLEGFIHDARSGA